jgi:UPF0042 nucleotide-binding protein
MGWEAVDNLPAGLVERLLSSPPPEGAPGDDQPLAIGIDSRTRGFDTGAIRRTTERLGAETLFLDCADIVLARRFSATRRRHPLGLDRPVADGIARERELLAPLRAAADHLIDTTDLSVNALQADLRARFADGAEGAAPPVLMVASFSYGRGLPRHADLVFDMRFLKNPHWVPALRPGTGLDKDVADYVADDPAYAPAMDAIEALILPLLPRYGKEGKSYVTLAFGCTGGRHRSVASAEAMAARLRAAGFSPTVSHRELAGAKPEAGERIPGEGTTSVGVGA